jgi:hypothetical protein
VIVRIYRRTKYLKKVHQHKSCIRRARTSPVVLFRGRLQMHEVRNGNPTNDLPLVHSNCLRGGNLSLSTFHASNAPFSLQGPAVLVPRVGEPNPGKIVLYKGCRKFALSDCVIAVKANIEDLTKVYDRLICRWEVFKGLYKGTGAKYVTVAEISDFLRSQGFDPRPPQGDSGWQIKRAVEAKPQAIDNDLLNAWRVMWNGKEH